MKKVLLLFLPMILLAKGYEEPWGKDSNLSYRQKETIHRKKSIASKVAHSVIHFHQKVLSPTTGPRSNFRPTSSKYMELAITRYGFLRGFVMGCDRLLRENNEEWVYRKIEAGDHVFKFDPARIQKN